MQIKLSQNYITEKISDVMCIDGWYCSWCSRLISDCAAYGP
jgi:hypothetical protein